MAEPWEESPEPAWRHPSGQGPPPPGTPPARDATERDASRGEVSERAADLWRLLGPGPDPLTDDAQSTTEAGSETKGGWDTTGGWDTRGGWEVERLPSAAEGGVAALFTTRPAGTGPAGPGTGPAGPGPAGPAVPGAPETAPLPGADGPTLDNFAGPRPAPPLGSQPPAWGLNPGVVPPLSGLARLAEMIDDLPNEPAPRVRPDDIEVDRPVLAPVAIWFWGDDDIYAGRIATRATAAARRRLGRRRTLTSD
jgi:hypothetical protein